ncbi:helix-turn-helix domain-containing protein [Clostridium sp. BJN0001]|uniref:helix-turn-helix domain-containing protein n=1 Tax=Clostridium sp. BJN0001 TaxID=2930219 RepID=UPI001FD11E70|nr:helix-turn-helix domain-containing protein [Clostridium sp. BJN0001]
MDNENNISYYAIIPAYVRYDKELTANAKLLYGEITALCNKNGICWASNAYFAELYKVSDRSIKKWLSQLINKGYVESNIKYQKGDVKSTKRYLSLPNLGRGIKVPEGGGDSEEKFTTPREEKFTLNNTSINNKKEKRKRKTEFDSLIDSYSQNEKLKNAIYEFIKHRKSLKIPLTTLALKKILNRLSKLANDDESKIEMIENSIMNGWRGIFSVKQQENKILSMPRNKTPKEPVKIDISKFGGI